MVGVLILFSLPALAPAFCRRRLPLPRLRLQGGPSWRGPDGLCVSKASLAQTCGSPPASPCKQEGAARACFGKQSAVTTPKAKTEPQ
jgi:hypothetical protein